MDKQKEIEEMAKVVQRDMCGDVPCEECNYHGKMKTLPRYCGTYLIAKRLYNAGYRKITENSVVLTKEAYNRLFTKARQSEIKTIDLESIVNARKETADKFAERLKSRFNKSREYYEIDTGTAWSDGQIGGLINDTIDKICKEFMEVKE